MPRVPLAALVLAVPFCPGEPARAEATAESMAALEATVREVARAATWKTVAIRIERSGMVRGFGSGAIVSPEGLVASCAHVTEAADPGGRLYAVFPDGTESRLQVVASNARNDLALCRMTPPREGLPHFEVAETDPEKGAWVVALGHPGGPFPDLQPTVTVGKVVDANRLLFVSDGDDQKDYKPAIQTDVPLFGGNSGGPLVDVQGRLVGINGAMLWAGDAAYAIPSSRIHRELPRLREGERVEGDEITFPEMMKAIQELTKEIDPADIVGMYADSGLGALLKLIAAMEGVGKERPARTGRRIDDLRAAYAGTTGPARTATLRVGEKTVGYACLWDRVAGRTRYVTSARLVPEGKAVTLVPPGGSDALPARVLGRDGPVDLALLVVAEQGPDVSEPSTAGDAEPGAWVLFPGPDGALYQAGAVAAVDRTIGDDRRMPEIGVMGIFRAPNTSPFRPFARVTHVDAPLREDQFGGPVVRPGGALVGIAVAHHFRACSFLVPASTVVGRIPSLERGASVPAPPDYDPTKVKPPPAPGALRSARARLERIGVAIARYRDRLGKWPEALADLEKPAADDDEPWLARVPRDAWGRAFTLRVLDDSAAVLESAGSDGKAGTEDDLSKRLEPPPPK